MPQLLIEPLISGTGMAYIGFSPGACFSMVLSGDQEKSVIEGRFTIAAAVVSMPSIRILSE